MCESEKNERKEGLFARISIIGVSVVAGVALLIALGSFLSNQNSFSGSFSLALKALVEATESEVSSIYQADSLAVQVQYLERIGELYRQASNSDLFILLYTFLSSVLLVVCLNLIKKGQDAQNCLQDSYDKLRESQHRLQESHDKLRENRLGLQEDFRKLQNNLDDKYTAFDKSMNVIEQRLSSLNTQANRTKLTIQDNHNFMQFSYVSQVLSDALASILCYSIAGRNDDMTRFTECIYQVSVWSEQIDFSKLDQTSVGKFTQRLGYVRSVYGEIVDAPEFHKKLINRQFDGIRNSVSK
jgi:hypothetical protein